MNATEVYINVLKAEIARLKTRVQEQNERIELLLRRVNGQHERIEQLLQDNADLKLTLALLEKLT
jgi:hypothetical protein